MKLQTEKARTCNKTWCMRHLNGHCVMGHCWDEDKPKRNPFNIFEEQ